MSSETRVFTPLDLCRVVKGKHVYGFLVKGIAKIGRMAKLLTAVAGLGIPLVYVINSTPVEVGRPSTFMVFYNFKDVNVKPEEVKQTLEKAARDMGLSVDVEIIEPVVPGIVVDTKHFPILFLGERAAILRKSVLEGWFLGVRKRFGTAAEVLLYYEGVEMGSRVYDDYVKAGVKKGDLWKLLSATLFAGGALSRMEVEFGEPMTVRMWDSMECEIGKGSETCFSRWTRGLIAGFASKYFGKKVTVVETRCIAKGDPYCEFTVMVEE